MNLSLEERLERAQDALACAKMIDSYPRMVAETDAAMSQIADIKRQIAERDMAQQSDVERAYIGGGVDALGDRHAG